MDSGQGGEARRGQVRRLAWILFLLSIAVVAISAYVRLNAAGLGCADWPQCYGDILAGQANLHHGIARVLHRAFASIALVLAFVLAWRAMQPLPLQPAARRSVALVVLMMVLAAIGIWSADPHRAGAIFLNILGGLGLVSLSWRVVIAAPGATAASRPGPLLGAALGALLATMALGALIGARYAAVSCTTLPFCGDTAWPGGDWIAALNPFVANQAAMAPGDNGGIALHLIHRYCAAATLLLLGGVAHRALHVAATRQAARLVLLLLALEIALGALTVASGFSLWLGVAHSVAAAGLLAATSGLRQPS